METVVVLLVLGFVGFCMYKINTSPEAVKRREEMAAQQAKIMCPHCGERGGVTGVQVKRKKGVSGGKATGALLTGGVSMLATGLSRKEGAMAMSCRNCGMKWDV